MTWSNWTWDCIIASAPALSRSVMRRAMDGAVFRRGLRDSALKAVARAVVGQKAAGGLEAFQKDAVARSSRDAGVEAKVQLVVAVGVIGGALRAFRFAGADGGLKLLSPLARQAADEAEGLEREDRLADGGAGDLVGLGKLGLVKKVAGVEVAEVDAVRDALDEGRDLRAGEGGHAVLMPCRGRLVDDFVTPRGS